MAHNITLSAGALQLAVCPDVGGSLAGLWHQGTPVLRSVDPATLHDPRHAACYPLLPYSNRLAHCHFNWHGQAHSTRPNFAGSAHSLHGVGWQRPWAVLEQAPHHLRLGYSHMADADWPFAFNAEQHIHLSPDALQMELRLSNTASTSQPAGLGWHPYFPKRTASLVALKVRSRWENDSQHLPTHTTPCTEVCADVRDLDLDHCFEGWDGAAHIEDGCFALSLSSSLPCVVVFTPLDRPHFCVEPVGHVNDAIHLAEPTRHGLVDLPPGHTIHAAFTLTVQAL